MINKDDIEMEQALSPLRERLGILGVSCLPHIVFTNFDDYLKVLPTSLMMGGKDRPMIGGFRFALAREVTESISNRDDFLDQEIGVA